MKKKGKCPGCCPDGGAIFDAATTLGNTPIWICRNCRYYLPRRIYRTKRKARVEAILKDWFPNLSSGEKR